MSTLESLLADWRRFLDDTVKPYLWSDEELVSYANDCIHEICEKCYAIREAGIKVVHTGSSNVSFSAANKTITKTDGRFASSGLKIGNKVTVTGTSNNNGTFTLTAVTETVLTVTETTTDEAGTSAVITLVQSPTVIPTYLGGGRYAIDSSIWFVYAANVAGSTTGLTILRDNALAWLDANEPSWRNMVVGTPKYVVAAESFMPYILLLPPPDAAGTLLLDVARRPYSDLTADDTSDSPELPVSLHRKLTDGVAAQAYAKQDAECYDIQKAEKHRKLFDAVIEGINVARLKNDQDRATSTPDSALV